MCSMWAGAEGTPPSSQAFDMATCNSEVSHGGTCDGQLWRPWWRPGSYTESSLFLLPREERNKLISQHPLPSKCKGPNWSIFQNFPEETPGTLQTNLALRQSGKNSHLYSSHALKATWAKWHLRIFRLDLLNYNLYLYCIYFIWTTSKWIFWHAYILWQSDTQFKNH